MTIYPGFTLRKDRANVLVLEFFLCRRAVLQSNGQILIQGMVDGSASKPALRQDTGYMVEKTYLVIAPYLGAFGAYLMPQ